ncbi:MAG: PhoH family protein [Proteobacteria bacterium]|nr:PhoH family protein [Pseudomonadota bacterium]
MKPKSQTGDLGAGDESVQIQFGDNNRLPMLYGEFDRHLARIEQQLGVSLSSRGNRVTLLGPADAVAVARATLNALYDRLGRGLSVDTQEVDAALRFATSAVADGDLRAESQFGGSAAIQTPRRHVSPRSPGQKDYVDALRKNELVFGVGPAGTGKTYLAVAMAVSMFVSGRVDRIILSRPAVEAGERLGFLPGDMRDKIDPYLRPLYDALHDMLPPEQVVNRLNSNEIEVAPLAFMRGRTLSNAFVILDEAQNTTHVQMKMFLTRIGENSRMVITGDLSQIDLPSGSVSGLREAVDIVSDIKGIALVSLTSKDVVRHPLVSKIVDAYDQSENKAARRAVDAPSRER